MFKVQITYKSGKIETTQIAISDYTFALVQLANEGRASAIKIIETTA